VAVTSFCDGCINAHTDAAIKAGAAKARTIDAFNAILG